MTEQKSTRPNQTNKQNHPHGDLKTRAEEPNKQKDPHGLLETRPETANKQGTPPGTLTTKGTQPTHNERYETLSLSGAYGGQYFSLSILNRVCGAHEGHPARRLNRNHKPRPHKAQAKRQPQSQRHKMMFQGIIMLLRILALASVHISTIRSYRPYLATGTRNHQNVNRLHWETMGNNSTSGQRPQVKEYRKE